MPPIFTDGSIEMYDSNFQLVQTFTDTDLPAGFAPFGIRTIKGKLYVTFAKQDAEKHDDAAGTRRGFVDVFDIHGNKLSRAHFSWSVELSLGFGAGSVEFRAV